MSIKQGNIQIALPDDVVNYLERLDYEVGGLQVLHSHAINSDVKEDAVKKIYDAFQERFTEYQLAKKEMFKEYGKGYESCKKWWLNFTEGVLNIEE